MSLSSISERLEILQQTTQSLSQLIQRLSRLQPTSDDHVANDEARQDLTAEIHDNLKQAEEDLEVIDQDIDDIASITSHKRTGANRSLSEREKETTEYVASCLRLREDIQNARVRFRKAQIQAKRNYELFDRKERAAYLTNLQAAAATSGTSQDAQDSSKEAQSYASMTASLFAGRRGPRKDQTSTQDDQLLTASNDVTSSLRRTHELLASEVSRSRFAQETLETSNAALQELNERYTGLDDLLAKSRGLVSTLLRSQKSDTWYLETAIKILLATVTWLLFRRLFYGPLWWFLYLPLKLCGKVLMAIFGGASALFGGSSSSTLLTDASTSLRVMPSATGKPPTIPEHMRGQGAYVPVGAGGAGAKYVENKASDQVAAESLSEYLGTAPSGTNVTQVWEAHATPPAESEQDQKDKSEEGDAKKEDSKPQQPVRGDGQPLRERDEAKEPRNPKKRMFEEPPPDEKRRDEL